MFWRLPFRPTSSLDATIAKDDVTLSIVLDDDDIIQEGKTQNPKLSDFISIPKHLNELVQLITMEPSSNIDEKLRYKYPNIACELLCSNMGNISEILLSDYFQNLTSFLNTEPTLNPLFSGFSCKVLNFLCRNKPNDFFNKFQQQTDILAKLLQHVGTSCCMDLILQLVTTGEHTPDVIMWLNEQKLIQSLVRLISVCSSTDVCYNASQTLLDILRVEKECSIDAVDTSILIQEMESEEVIGQILCNIFMKIDGPSQNIYLQCGISFLQGLLQPSRSFDQMVYPDLSLPIRLGNCNIGIGSTSEAVHKAKDLALSQGGKNVLNLLSRGVFDFHILLKDSPVLQFRGLPILGYRRLVIIKLLSAILHASPSESHNRFILSGVLSTLLDLFLSFPWNNFLHTQVEFIVKTLLSPMNSYDGENREFDQVIIERDDKFLSPETFKLILNEGQIVEKILTGWETNLKSQMSQGKRMGYMGHLTNITNKLLNVIQKDKQLLTIFDECILGDLAKEWELLVSQDLKNVNSKNESKMGGESSLTNFIPLGDETLRDPIIHQGYTEYQLYTVATNFDDGFGIEDEVILEDVGVTPFSALDSLEFSIRSDEEKSVTEAFVNMCKETIHLFNETKILGHMGDSAQSSDSDEWLSHPIKLSSTCLNKLQISDVESDEDEDDEDHEPIVPEKIKSSSNETSDLIETHIIYTQTVDSLKSQQYSIDSNAVILQQEDIPTIDHVNNSGLSWPLDDETDANSWAEFGPFSNISSSESRTEEYSMFENLVDVKEINFQDNSNDSSDEDNSIFPPVPSTNNLKCNILSEENTSFSNNLLPPYQQKNQTPALTLTEHSTDDPNISETSFASSENDKVESDNCDLNTVVDDNKSSLTQMNINNNNNNNEENNFIFLQSLGLFHEAKLNTEISLNHLQNLPPPISTHHTVGDKNITESIGCQLKQLTSLESTITGNALSTACKSLYKSYFQFSELADITEYPL